MQVADEINSPDLKLAERLFENLRATSFDGIGITRDTYGRGEEQAHELMKKTAKTLGLEISTDAALNLYMTLPGKNRNLPAVMTGSHLDSVPKGGNYDGAAGVIAGMAILAGFVKTGHQPVRDITVMGIRAEESAWFPVSYIGSKAAFHQLSESDLDARRFDTHRSLREHMTEMGGLPERVVSGPAFLQAEKIDCFIELHIEQGPVLIRSEAPIGIVTGICGSLRYRKARVLGRYAHSGATPRTYRSDAVVALSTLISEMQTHWEALERAGHEFTLTFGQVFTEPERAEISKVSGQVDFCVDIRSRSKDTMAVVDRTIQNVALSISEKTAVKFEWGNQTGSTPAIMDKVLQGDIERAARNIGQKTVHMPSGAGHDAANFANQSIPTAMIFVRNANGSHNPQEAMTMEDFSVGVKMLGDVIAHRANRK